MDCYLSYGTWTIHHRISNHPGQFTTSSDRHPLTLAVSVDFEKAAICLCLCACVCRIHRKEYYTQQCLLAPLVVSCLGFPFVLWWTAQWWIVLRTFSYLLLLMEISGSLVGCEGTQLVVHELLSTVLGTLEGKEMVAEQTDYPARQASKAACVSEVLSIIYFLQLRKSLGFVFPHTVIPCLFFCIDIYIYICIHTYTFITFVDVTCSLKSTKVQFSVGVVILSDGWPLLGKIWSMHFAWCLLHSGATLMWYFLISAYKTTAEVKRVLVHMYSQTFVVASVVDLQIKIHMGCQHLIMVQVADIPRMTAVKWTAALLPFCLITNASTDKMEHAAMNNDCSFTLLTCTSCVLAMLQWGWFESMFLCLSLGCSQWQLLPLLYFSPLSAAKWTSADQCGTCCGKACVWKWVACHLLLQMLTAELTTGTEVCRPTTDVSDAEVNYGD